MSVCVLSSLSTHTATHLHALMVGGADVADCGCGGRDDMVCGEACG